MKEIAPDIFVETEYALVTVGAVLTGEGWVCIDTPPYPRDAQAWRTSLQAISPKPVRYVINTDYQRDRILGNCWFDAPVVVHLHTAEAMLSLRSAFISQAAEEMSANDNELVDIASLKITPPHVSYTTSLALHSGSRAIHLHHRPSATPGTTWVVLPDEKVIFAGDSIVVDQHPHIADGLTKPWLDSLRALRQPRYADWTIVPGRGRLKNIAETERLSEYLRVARRRVGGLLRAGRPRSDVVSLVVELLPLFPFRPENKEEVQRRIKTGLEAIYEELRNSQEVDDSD